MESKEKLLLQQLTNRVRVLQQRTHLHQESQKAFTLKKVLANEFYRIKQLRKQELRIKIKNIHSSKLNTSFLSTTRIQPSSVLLERECLRLEHVSQIKHQKQHNRKTLVQARKKELEQKQSNYQRKQLLRHSSRSKVFKFWSQKLDFLNRQKQEEKSRRQSLVKSLQSKVVLPLLAKKKELQDRLRKVNAKSSSELSFIL